MRKSRFADAQIIGMIKEQEADFPTAELCRTVPNCAESMD
jgi:putative transposase